MSIDRNSKCLHCAARRHEHLGDERACPDHSGRAFTHRVQTASPARISPEGLRAQALRFTAMVRDVEAPGDAMRLRRIARLALAQARMLEADGGTR